MNGLICTILYYFKGGTKMKKIENLVMLLIGFVSLGASLVAVYKTLVISEYTYTFLSVIFVLLSCSLIYRSYKDILKQNN